MQGYEAIRALAFEYDFHRDRMGPVLRAQLDDAATIDADTYANARRTTRRVVRRSSIYVATLPAACARTSVNGTVVWRCGGAYYQPYGGRYVVVYVD